MKKFQRIYHLPWSPGATNDDKTLKDVSLFDDKEVVVTVKMDGENWTLSHDYCHARGLDYTAHPSRSIMKSKHAELSETIPNGFRVIVEYLYAKHSIHYKNLKSYFYGICIFSDGMCLSWDDTKEWLDLIGITPVDEIYRGVWDEGIIKSFNFDRYGEDEMEGYVVRLASSFKEDIIGSFAKYVRANHIKTDSHWRNTKIIENKIMEGCETK